MSPLNTPERQSSISKDIRLEEMRRIVDSFVTIHRNEEGAEMRVAVDPQLRETLALLLVLGMRPDQSCFGHPERASKDNLVSLTPEITMTGQLPDREYTLEEVEAAGAEADEQAKRLQLLLEGFYQNRPVCRDDARIIVDHHDGMPDLKLRSNIERDNLLGYSEEERRQCIETARREWKDFEAYLFEAYLKQV